MRRAIFFVVVAGTMLLMAGRARAAAGIVQLELPGFYRSANVALGTGDASYLGWSYGAGMVGRMNENKQSFAWRVGYDRESLKNSSDGPATETWSGNAFNIGLRFYSAGLFLGAGVVYARREFTYTNGAASTVTRYRGTGLRLETGIDLPLSKSVVLVPAFQFEAIRMYSAEGAERRASSLGFGLALGLQF